MRTGAGEMNDTIDKGRRTIELSKGEIDEIEERRVPPVVIMAGVVGAMGGVGVLGWMIYRRRQRRDLIPQIQDAVPGYVPGPSGGLRSLPSGPRSLPSELRSRAKS